MVKKIEKSEGLDEIEREHILKILRDTNGHKTKTAEWLKISRPKLYRLMKRYGILNYR